MMTRFKRDPSYTARAPKEGEYGVIQGMIGNMEIHPATTTSMKCGGKKCALTLKMENAGEGQLAGLSTQITD